MKTLRSRGGGGGGGRGQIEILRSLSAFKEIESRVKGVSYRVFTDWIKELESVSEGVLSVGQGEGGREGGELKGAAEWLKKETQILMEENWVPFEKQRKKRNLLDHLLAE